MRGDRISEKYDDIDSIPKPVSRDNGFRSIILMSSYIITKRLSSESNFSGSTYKNQNNIAELIIVKKINIFTHNLYTLNI